MPPVHPATNIKTKKSVMGKPSIGAYQYFRTIHKCTDTIPIRRTTSVNETNIPIVAILISVREVLNPGLVGMKAINQLAIPNKVAGIMDTGVVNPRVNGWSEIS